MLSQLFVKACTCIESGYVVDRPINQNSNVHLPVGQKIGTRMPVSRPSDMDRQCHDGQVYKHVAPRNSYFQFLLRLVHVKLQGNSPAQILLKTHILEGKNG